MNHEDELCGLLRRLMRSPSIKLDRITDVPAQHGIYRIHSRAGNTLYIGTTKTRPSLRERVRELFGRGHTLNGKLRDAWGLDAECVRHRLRRYYYVQVVAIRNPRIRKWLEHFAIAILQPPHND